MKPIFVSLCILALPLSLIAQEPPHRPLKIDWKVPIFAPYEFGDELSPGFLKAKELCEGLLTAKRPFLLGKSPVAHGDVVMYSQWNEIRCRQLVKTKTERKANTHWMSTEQDGALASLLGDSHTKVGIQSSHDRLSALMWPLESALSGALSRDGNQVFAVDDAALVPELLGDPGLGRFGRARAIPGRLLPQINENTLYAFDIDTGLARWSLGGEAIREAKVSSNLIAKSRVADSVFLGAPTPLDGKLWVLNENAAGIIRLVHVDPAKFVDRKPRILKEISIVEIPQKQSVRVDFRRRLCDTRPIHVADLVVCPTHAGLVAAWDRTKEKWAWEYRYPSTEFVDGRNAMPLATDAIADIMKKSWKPSQPMIDGETLVIGPTDSHQLHAIDLSTGKKRWVSDRAEGDWYPAAMKEGKILIVRSDGVRFVRMTDGSALANLELGPVMGRGLAHEGMYYQPLLRAGKPTIAVIDLAKGTVREYLDVESVGNLTLHEGRFLAQSVLEMIAFEPLSTEGRR